MRGGLLDGEGTEGRGNDDAENGQGEDDFTRRDGISCGLHGKQGRGPDGGLHGGFGAVCEHHEKTFFGDEIAAGQA